MTRRLAALVTILACAGAIPSQAGGPKAPKTGDHASSTTALEHVLDRFDEVQSTIHTLSAKFVQTTRNPLLKAPMIAKGEFYLTKPDSVLWEYTEPEPMRFTVADGEYTGYFPERKRAEKRDIKRWSEQLFRFFGLGQGSKELEKFYEIALGDPGPRMKDSYLLVLTPKKRRIKKNVEEVKLWVGTSSLLPERIDYIGKDGAEREIRFVDTRVNPDLAASLYHQVIPKDVSISNGFSGFDASAGARGH
jgi:outer membrane lipoprotein-sorting protein